ncbi:MAG: hypothetical protein ACD_24C00071G0001 [uncultured bacterium]|nr:MAG: hypothetical protein ACD_24C00071G0001 [uncultured bacterium]
MACVIHKYTGLLYSNVFRTFNERITKLNKITTNDCLSLNLAKYRDKK